MKKVISYAIPLVLVVGLIFTSYKACDLYDENSVLKGRDIELTKKFEENLSELQQLTSDNAILLAELEDGRRAAEEAARKYESAANEIRDTFRTVGELRANAENDKALIVELEIELNKRDETIGILVGAIEKFKEERSLMRKQYTALSVELNKTKQLLEESIELNILRADRIKQLEKSLAGSRMGSQLKTGAVIGLAAVVVYGLVSK